MAAKKMAQRMKHLKDSKVTYIGTGANENLNQTTLKISHCTYCRKNYHTATECWNLHSELKKKAGIKKCQFNRNTNGSKWQKPATNEQNEFNFGGASVYLMTSSSTDLRNLWVLDIGCTQHLSHQR